MHLSFVTKLLKRMICVVLIYMILTTILPRLVQNLRTTLNMDSDFKEKHNLKSALNMDTKSMEKDQPVFRIDRSSMSYVSGNVSSLYASEYVDVKDMFDLPEMPYLSDYRNPCWNERDTTGEVRVRCVPHFYLAGVEKCGTTDLYNSIIKHEEIAPPPEKEFHYWAKSRLRKYSTFRKYLDIFQNASYDIFTNTTNSGSYHPKVTFDASPDTFLHNYAVKKLGFQNVDDFTSNPKLTPFQIHRLTPKAKIVLIVRDPIDRLYSSYSYFPMTKGQVKESAHNSSVDPKFKLSVQSFNGKSPEDFHDKVKAALQWFENCTRTFPQSHHCAFWNAAETEVDNFVNHMQMGFYGPILLTWLKVFPIENFKVIRLEDYSKEKITELNKVFKFLGLSSASENYRRQIVKMAEVGNVGKRQLNHGPMRQETRELLSSFYQPVNKILSQILDCPDFLYDT